MVLFTMESGKLKIYPGGWFNKFNALSILRDMEIYQKADKVWEAINDLPYYMKLRLHLIKIAADKNRHYTIS